MNCTCGHDEYVHGPENSGCIVPACNCEEFTKADADPGFDKNDWGDE